MSCENYVKKYLSKGEEEYPEYFESFLEYFLDKYYRDFFYDKKTDTLYRIEDKNYDPSGDIIEAKRLDSNNIEYILQYYNGGARFEECLEEALDKLNKR